MAESILNRKGFPSFTAYSAGSHPAGRVNPHALKQIAGGGMPVEGLRSKSWDEFEIDKIGRGWRSRKLYPRSNESAVRSKIGG
jgi:protein-tyrosine-phosphatase